MTVADLPSVDEHATDIAAGADDVWRVLVHEVDKAFSGGAVERYGRIIGCADRTASGPRPLAEGSTLPGFRVATAVPGAELVLAGRHRFSSYALIFRIDPVSPGRTRLRAETRAAFPGVTGGAYRLLVISTGGHAVGVRRLLSTVKRQAES
jgi:hypothetical protein